MASLARVFRSHGALRPLIVGRLSSRSARYSMVSRLPRLSAPPACRAPTTFARFSTARIRLETEGQVNLELSAKLEQELALERDMNTDELPVHLKEYLDNTPFTLQDTPGSEDVVLTRTFGDEKIRVVFSISDLNNVEDESDQLPDEVYEDELEDTDEVPTDTQSGGANSKGAINQGRTSGGNFKIAPEDSIAPSDRPEESSGEAEPQPEPTFPAHLLITVERPMKGSLQIHAVAQDGLMIIENATYLKDSKLVDPKTAENEFSARNLYTGPPFHNLDEDVQVLFEKYLDERDINTTMALFVPDYIDFKEQREYLNWLTNVKDFVD